MKKFPFSFLFLFLPLWALKPFPAGAEPVSPLPAIIRLDSRDTSFRQYLEDVEAARRALFLYGQSRAESGDDAQARNIVSSMTIYSYIPEDGEDLFGIAARCSITYAALASLNRLSHKEDMIPGKALLLPSVPGLFIPENPGTDLERLLSSARTENPGVVLSIPRETETEKFRFIPGGDFSPAERIFFLNRGFHFPLARFVVSSSYGPRVSPITGKPGMHGGLDLAAPEGTNVYAARAGTVVETGEDPVLGNYVIMSHENNWVSLYGHLSAISTTLRAELQSTNLIGKVGSTGLSTGPHLHFELRQNGRSRDPARLLGIFKESTGR